jgi:hypothetical protein
MLLASSFLQPRPVQTGPATTSVEQIVSPNAQTAAASILRIHTYLDILYSPIVRIDDSLLISVTVRQAVIEQPIGTTMAIDSQNGLPVGGNSGQNLKTIEWPVRLRIGSSAFDWGDDVRDRELLKGASIPEVVRWAPTAKSLGDKVVLLQLQNLVDQASWGDEKPAVDLLINGKPSQAGENEDVPLSVSVRDSGGFSANTVYWATRIGGGVLAISGIFTWIGFPTILGWVRRRRANRGQTRAKKADALPKQEDKHKTLEQKQKAKQAAAPQQAQDPSPAPPDPPDVA